MIALAPREAILPTKYIIHVKSQSCSGCGATHTWSELYSFAIERGNIRRLTQLDTPRYNLPIERRTDPTRSIPFCHECHSPSLEALPQIPRGAIVSGARDPAPDGAKPTTKPTAGPRRVLTPHDLLTLLKKGSPQ